MRRHSFNQELSSKALYIKISSAVKCTHWEASWNVQYIAFIFFSVCVFSLCCPVFFVLKQKKNCDNKKLLSVKCLWMCGIYLRAFYWLEFSLYASHCSIFVVSFIFFLCLYFRLKLNECISSIVTFVVELSAGISHLKDIEAFITSKIEIKDKKEEMNVWQWQHKSKMC